MPIWQPLFHDPADTTVAMPPARLLDAARAHHQDCYRTDPTGAATAPATWSLLGEHTDHSGGVVLTALAQWSVAVTVSTNENAVINVATISGDKGLPDRQSITVDEVAMRATAQQSAVNAHGRPIPAPTPEGGSAARLGGIAWTMIHRQMLSRDTRGLDITVVSTIPPTMGLGETAATEVATALALFGEQAEDPPARARLAEICSQSASMFAEAVPLRARHTTALRGENTKVSVIDYADGSVTQVPHPVSKSAALRAFAVMAPAADVLPNQVEDTRRRQNFIDAATRAFSVESLRLLPDATVRVAEWLQAVIEVSGRRDFPTVDQAQNWLGFWEEETVRAQRLSSALRSRRRQDIAELIRASQRDLTCVYGIPGADAAVIELCLGRGALSARSASAGNTHAVIVLVDAPKALNFSADLADDGLLVVPLDHGDVAYKAY